MLMRKKEKNAHCQRFIPAMHSDSKQRFSLENDLHRAINHEEFVLYYQPQFEIPSRKVVGVEALIRWNHPTKGIVAPNQFLPYSEETGLITKIEHWVIREGFAMAKRMQDRGFDELILSLNLFCRTVDSIKFVDTCKKSFARNGCIS